MFKIELVFNLIKIMHLQSLATNGQCRLDNINLTFLKQLFLKKVVVFSWFTK